MASYTLGELESEIMDLLWQHNGNTKCTVQFTLQELRKRRSTNIAYTTVATVLNRLYEKKLVSRTSEKNFHYFSPKVTKNEFSQSVVQRFMNDFMSSFGDVAIPSFAGGLNNLNEKDKRMLIELLETNNSQKERSSSSLRSNNAKK